MAITYSDLKLALITTGTETGNWGTITNLNLTAIQQAISETASVAFSSADETLTLTDTNTSQTARNLRLVCTGTSGGARNLNVPDVDKLYLVTNNLADTVTVKTVAGSGIAVPTGKSAILYCDGVNVVSPIDYLNSVALLGTPTAPTAAPGTDTTQIASTAFANASASAAVVAERTAPATLENKTLSLTTNVISGITASSFVVTDSSGQIEENVTQKVIPAGVVVGTTDTQTLTNKTLTSPTLTTPAVDVINEATSDAGVTVDGVLLKDGLIGAQYRPLTLATAQNVSGTSVTFSSIPSWVKRITFILNNVVGGSGGFGLQLGDSGGLETTGYDAVSFGSGGSTTSTTNFVVRNSGDADPFFGAFTVVNISGNTWIATHAIRGSAGSGVKTLSGTLDRVALITGGYTFTTGSVNIIYE